MSYPSTNTMAADTTYDAKRTAAARAAQGGMPVTNNGTGPQHPQRFMAAPLHEAPAHMTAHGMQGPADVGMSAVVNQLSGLGINAGPVGPNSTVPGMMGSYVATTADGQVMYPAGYAPAGFPTLGYAQAPDAASAGFPPYIAQPGFQAYVPYPYVPYTPRGILSERSDVNAKEVPALENRRSSYSTNESTPATPFFGGSMAARDQASRVAVFDRSTYTTPSPQQYLAAAPGVAQNPKAVYTYTVPVDRDLDALLVQEPAIPQAVPAVFTPRKSMKTLDQSLVNNIPGNRNVYIRGLHPTTDDDLLLRYAERFGKVETSKAIIDTTTGACKGFGFSKFYDVRDSEMCIRGFYRLGYEVGFARASSPKPEPKQPSLLTVPSRFPKTLAIKPSTLAPETVIHLDGFYKSANLDGFFQESFNSRLKAEGDDDSTNLYISNLPRHYTEAELGAVFMGYTILSSKILRDPMGNSRGVGFESRDICDAVIEEYQGVNLGPDGLAMQIRYADTPAQKELKRVTAERRQFRTNEYNVGAYGTTMVGVGTAMYNQQAAGPRRPFHAPASADFNSRVGFINRRGQGRSLGAGAQTEYAPMLPAYYHIQPTHHQQRVYSAQHDKHFQSGHDVPSPAFPQHVAYAQSGDKHQLGSSASHSGDTEDAEPGIVNPGNGTATSEDGSSDEGVTVHVNSPLVANGSCRSSPVKQEKKE
ncbi:hypothetical protein F5Y18DRAFT_426677 [Xylariaceae sp. FL1019]|nr:hypothetical protein F5Y18DRAFT_426677 [Xylariaceae sp. FL1019]